jgi:hypothetical protein
MKKRVQRNEQTAIITAEALLTTRQRLAGLLPLIFFLIHALYYVRHGGLGHILWMCNISNLLLAAGILLNQPRLVRAAVLWLILGLPLWLYFVVLRGEWLLTSSLAHVGGLAVGLFALAKVRADRWSWLCACAFAWFLFLQQVCRWVTPAELNVNVAHRIYSGWEQVFSAYWQFWLATAAAVGTGLWVMGTILSKLLPSPPVRS